jgi:hypothetical protein
VLLEKIVAAAPGAVPYGIDVDATRIEHARLLQPRHAGNFVAGDLLDDEQLWPDDRRYALAILMPGRLVEAGAARSQQLLERLRDRCDRVLAYAYDDWLERPDGLAGLAAEAGLSLVDPAPGSRAGLAAAPPG